MDEQEKTSIEETVDELIQELVAYNASLQIAHWKADTSTNEHKTLGYLYNAMISLTDKFAESYMGEYGVIDFIPGKEIERLHKPATQGCELIEELCEAVNEDYLCNILQEMQAELYKAKYLLKE